MKLKIIKHKNDRRTHKIKKHFYLLGIYRQLYNWLVAYRMQSIEQLHLYQRQAIDDSTGRKRFFDAKKFPH